MYLDVSGKSHTELTFALDYLQPEFYSCPDRFGFLEANSRQFDSVNMFFFFFYFIVEIFLKIHKYLIIITIISMETSTE